MSPRTHPLGAGRDARASRLTFTGPLRGARWIVRSDAERLIRIAEEFLRDEGFVPHGADLAAELLRRGSEWTAVALQLGDEERSTRGRWLSILTEQIPIPLPRMLQPVLPPLLVVAAARRVSNGVGELVVFPHTSGRGHPAHSRAAAPRVRAALEAITAAAGAEGAMLSHESLAGIPNDGSPASQAMVREVLGWR